MKYTDIRTIPVGEPIVLDTNSSPVTRLTSANKRYATLAMLVDLENYKDSSWTGGDTPWAFDPATRVPVLNLDPASRTKRFLVRIIDKVTLQPTGENMVVMPKHILGRYSEVQAEWSAQFEEEKREEEKQELQRRLSESAREVADVRAESAKDSIRESLAVILKRVPVDGTDYRIQISGKTDWNEARGTAIPRVDGNITMSYSVYSLLMERLYESVDA